MNKSIKIVSVAVTAVTLATVTTAFALSRRSNPEINRSHAALTPFSVAVGYTSPVVTRKDNGDGDGEEEDDGPLTAAITPNEAKTAALGAQPGTAGKTELEKENGTTVYGVDVMAADGSKYDVKVDANTGKVLKSEVDDAKEGKDGDGDGEEKEDAK